MSRAEYEQKLREKHSPLQEAWEQYQILLKMYESVEPYQEPRNSANDILNKLRARVATDTVRNKAQAESKPRPKSSTSSASDILSQIRKKLSE